MKFFHQLESSLKSFSTILLDVDGTLAADRGPVISPLFSQAINNLKVGRRIILVSNGREREELSRLASLLGVDFVSAGRKPNPFIKRALGSFDGQTAVVVGDKFLTDGMWANFLGLSFIKVERVVTGEERFFTAAVNRVDDIIFWLVSLVRLFRPRQWVKNILVFAPVIFASEFFLVDKLIPTLGAFVLFSLVAAGIYGFNDILDLAIDANHPKKRFRPLPSLDVSVRTALTISTLAVVLGLGGAIWYLPAIFPWLLGYFMLAAAYSLSLKHLPVIEIISLVIFYLLRVWVGGAATETFVSAWLIGCTAFVALLLALGKRQSELSREAKREVLRFYDQHVLKSLMYLTAGIVAVSYAFYLGYVHGDKPLLWLSWPLVVLALGRFFVLLHRDPLAAETPERLWLKDSFLALTILTWFVFLSTLLYT